MAATTTLLGLLTPTQGTLSGTWGDSVNYGISDYHYLLQVMALLLWQTLRVARQETQ